MNDKYILLLLALALLPSATMRADEAPVILTLGSVEGARPISPLFSGISMETELVLPSADGSYYLSPKNFRLVALFKQLGVRHLRIGGNTVDDNTKTPELADIDELFAFAKAAGLKITYSVRLRGGDPKKSAEIAKHIQENYKDILTGITIGNESNNYYNWSEYLAASQAHAKAMLAAAPGISLNGPGIHLDATWLLQYAAAFKGNAKIDYIGAHAYFGGNACEKKGGVVVERDPAPLRASMLSRHGKYDKFYQRFGPMLAKMGLPFRLDETNTYYMGGAPGASNSMAASIWALDYLYWWAEHGAEGINFHTGSTLPYGKGSIPNGATRKPGFYAVFWDLPQGGYATQAVGYGMKAFDLVGHGKLFPVQAVSTDNAHVEAHAVLADDGSVFLTLLNEEIGAMSRQFILNQPKGGRFTHAQAITLGVKGNDAGSTEGFTIGGAGIGTDGSWDGKWDQVITEGDTFTVTIAPTSAVILHLKK